jgi:Flp pilus assembly pilin Flp
LQSPSEAKTQLNRVSILATGFDGGETSLLNWFHQEEKGQAMVELALIMPVIILMLMGMFEFGRMFNAYFTVAHAAREGARAAAVGASDTNIVIRVRESAPTLMPANLQVKITPLHALRQRGSAVQVEVRYSISIITPVISAISPNPILLKGVTIMRME